MNSNYAQIYVWAFGMLAIMFSLPYSNQGMAFMCYLEHPTFVIKEDGALYGYLYLLSNQLSHSSHGLATSENKELIKG